MDVYQSLGVARRINGAGSLTRLGGSLMPEEVLVAMRQAAGAFVDIAELQAAASRVIAKHTGAEAGLVSSGAAAALTLGTAAILSGLDVFRMERLPDTRGMPNQLVMSRFHRTAYDHAFRAAGARIVEVGYNDRLTGAGVRGVEIWEMEAAITDETAGIAYLANPTDDPSLEAVCTLAAKHGLPVIVDAAAQLPPMENLSKFIRQGASLVAYSGGKALRGPQGTGILCGKRDLIASALLQQIDMDVSPDTWNPPDLIPREKLNGLPHHGLGRGFKVGKEDIVGVVTALERFTSLDQAQEGIRYIGMLEELAKGLAGQAQLRTRLLSAEETGRYPLLEISLDESGVGQSAFEVSQKLQAREMPVHLSERRAAQGALTVDPSGLREGDNALVAMALKEVLQG